MPALVAGQYGSATGIDINILDLFANGNADGVLLQVLYNCGGRRLNWSGGQNAAIWSLAFERLASPQDTYQLVLLVGPWTVAPGSFEPAGARAPRRIGTIPMGQAAGYHRVEAFWGTSQWTNPGGAGTYLANGFVEIKIDGAVRLTVAGLGDLHALPYPGQSGVGTIVPEDKWNMIAVFGTFRRVRAVDNWYVKRTSYCTAFSGTGKCTDVGPEMTLNDDCETGTLTSVPLYINDGFSDFIAPDERNTQRSVYTPGVGVAVTRGVDDPTNPLQYWNGIWSVTFFGTGSVPEPLGDSSRNALCGSGVPTPPIPGPEDRALEVSWVNFAIPEFGGGDEEEIHEGGCPTPDEVPGTSGCPTGGVLADDLP